MVERVQGIRGRAQRHRAPRHRSPVRQAGDGADPVRVPPRTRVEETVLDLAEASACFDDALAWTVAAWSDAVQLILRC